MTTEPINDGGPAFPQFQIGKSVPSGEQVVLTFGGMTLRDYFAAAALTGIYASGPKGMDYDADKLPLADWADCAYSQADAMIRQRSL